MCKRITHMECEEHWIPNCLVFPGGGSKGFNMLGCVMYMEKKKLLGAESNPKQVIGVSIGASIAVLYLCGYTAEEMIDKFCDFQLTPKVKPREAMERSGAMSPGPFLDQVRDAIKEKLGMVPSMEQLFKLSGIHLTIITANYSTSECVQITPESHPSLSAMEAISMSINIPGVFYKLVYGGDTYADGMMANPYPVDICDKEGNRVLAFDVVEPTNNEYNIQGLARCQLELFKKNIKSKCSDRVRHLTIKTKYSDTLGFSLTKDQKSKMVVEGYLACKDFFESGRRAISLSEIGDGDIKTTHDTEQR